MNSGFKLRWRRLDKANLNTRGAVQVRLNEHYVEPCVLEFQADGQTQPDFWERVEVVGPFEPEANVKAPTLDEMEVLALDLKDAWLRYRKLFGEDPYGTEPQMKALLALTRRYGAKPSQSDANAKAPSQRDGDVK